MEPDKEISISFCVALAASCWLAALGLLVTATVTEQLLFAAWGLACCAAGAVATVKHLLLCVMLRQRLYFDWGREAGRLFELPRR